MVELRKEGFNELNLDLESRVVNFEFSDFNQKTIKLNFDVFDQKFVFLFVGLNVNSNCYSKSLFFNNFMDVFKNLNNLRHNNDFLNNLFKNVRNFNQFLFMGDD